MLRALFLFPMILKKQKSPVSQRKQGPPFILKIPIPPRPWGHGKGDPERQKPKACGRKSLGIFGLLQKRNVFQKYNKASPGEDG